MLKKVKVVYVSKYDDFNDDSGKTIEGKTKVTYFDSDIQDDETASGYEVNTIRLPLSRFKELMAKEKPFDAEVEFVVKHDKVKYTDLFYK